MMISDRKVMAAALIVWVGVAGKLASQNQNANEPLAPVETALEGNRAYIVGTCDISKNYVISKNNGARHTIKWPKNTGMCSVSIFSLNNAGTVIAGSAQVLAAGQQIESHTSAVDAQWTAFSCPAGLGDVCRIEIDR